MYKMIIYFWVGLALILSARFVDAQSVSTIPQGVMTFSLPGGSTTYLSLPLTGEPSYAGAVSTVTAAGITVADTPAPWTAGSLAGSTPYFVKFLSGAEMGRVVLVEGNTANSLTLDTSDNSSQVVSLTTSGFNVGAGDTFEIFPGDTLASVLGNNTADNPLVLQGAPSMFTADSVSVYSPSLLRWQAYFFNTIAGCWQLSGSTANANNTVLYPYGALSVTRRTGGASTSLVLTGRVAEVPILTKTTGSNAIVYGSTDYPVDMTLSQLGFGASWITGTSAVTADTVNVWTAALDQFEAFYQKPDATWRNSTNAAVDQSSYVIPAGSVISILQRATTSRAASFLSSVMPYTVN